MAADPRLRDACDSFDLTLLRHLARGPAMVSKLAMLAGASRSRVSKRLATLCGRGLACRVHQGPQEVFHLADPALASDLSADARTGGESSTLGGVPPVIFARTCHDHLAGQVGVALFEALVALGAILDPGPPKPKGTGPKTPVALGPAAPEVFGGLGIDLDALRRRNSRFAFACLDWTERRGHLGGALGAALFEKFMSRGWLIRGAETRAVTLSEEGRRGLSGTFGIGATGWRG